MASQARQIRVNLQEIAPTGGFNKTVDMPAVPRVGDYIVPSPNSLSATFTVRDVIWTPGFDDCDVQVRFR